MALTPIQLILSISFSFFFILNTYFTSLTHLNSEYSSTSFASYGPHTKPIIVSYFYSLICYALYNLSINEFLLSFLFHHDLNHMLLLSGPFFFFFTSFTCYCPHTKSITVFHYSPTHYRLRTLSITESLPFFLFHLNHMLWLPDPLRNYPIFSSLTFYISLI